MSVTKLDLSEPTFQMVSVDKLTIDPRVQRKEGVDQRRVQQIADEYDRAALGAITVQH